MKRWSMPSILLLTVLLACVLAGLAGAQSEITFGTEEIMKSLKSQTRTGYLVMNTFNGLEGIPGHTRYDWMLEFSKPSLKESGMGALVKDLPRELYVAMRVAVPVHEACHAITNILCSHGATGGDVIPRCGGTCGAAGCMCIWPSGGEPIMVPFTETFPGSRIAGDYPPELLKAEEAAQHRYAEYIYPSKQNHATQRHGVYGLLNEYNAYLTGARAAFEVEPAYRKNAGKNPEIYKMYFGALMREMFAYPQFRMYILHYLSYAKDNEKDVYRGIMENVHFRKAFRAVDAAWKKLADDYLKREREIRPFLASRGYNLHGTNGLPKVLYKVIYGSMRDKYFTMAAAEMDKERYKAVLKELRKE